MMDSLLHLIPFDGDDDLGTGLIERFWINSPFSLNFRPGWNLEFRKIERKT